MPLWITRAGIDAGSANAVRVARELKMMSARLQTIRRRSTVMARPSGISCTCSTARPGNQRAARMWSATTVVLM
jgi:hypothetical protein